MCVQRRLVCSAGDKPAGARVRSPVVWIAGWRETETLKPVDKVSLGGDHEPPGRNNSERGLGGVEATARWQGHAKQLEKPSSSQREITGAG